MKACVLLKPIVGLFDTFPMEKIYEILHEERTSNKTEYTVIDAHGDRNKLYDEEVFVLSNTFESTQPNKIKKD